MKIIKRSLIVSALMIAGCSSKTVGFQPPGVLLPDAIFGARYSQIIYIGHNLDKNLSFLNQDNTSVEIQPKNSGVVVAPVGDDESWTIIN